MSIFSRLIPLVIAAVFASHTVHADPQLSNLSESEFEDLSKEISGNLMHHSVQGAGTLGSIFGFEVGLVGGQTSSPTFDKVSKDSGGDDIPNLYHVGVLGVLTVPLGFTGEIIILPKTTAGPVTLQMTSAAIKYTMSEELLVLPFNLGLRAFMSSSNLSFTQTDVTIGTATIENKNTVTGFQILASPKLPIAEPYAGIGFLSAKNELSTNGTPIFDPSVTLSQSRDVNLTTTQLLLGVTANLAIVRLGAEYSSAFGNNSITAKLAFGF